MDAKDEISLIRQMLDITQRRIDRNRRTVRQATDLHQSAADASSHAQQEYTHASVQAPIRRRALLADLTGGGLARSADRLVQYSNQTEQIQREVSDLQRAHAEADANRIRLFESLAQANTVLRASVIRHEKWTVLSEESANHSIEW